MGILVYAFGKCLVGVLVGALIGALVGGLVVGASVVGGVGASVSGLVGALVGVLDGSGSVVGGVGASVSGLVGGLVGALVGALVDGTLTTSTSTDTLDFYATIRCRKFWYRAQRACKIICHCAAVLQIAQLCNFIIFFLQNFSGFCRRNADFDFDVVYEVETMAHTGCCRSRGGGSHSRYRTYR